jgi:osmoprotectant transport system permease protein
MVWLWQNLVLVLGLTLDHARLSVVPVLVSLIASIPLGWLASQSRILRIVLLGIGGILFTIPSFALFTSLPPILGTRILDEANVVVALCIYGVAVMVRGSADAFASVSKDVIGSSTAVGFSRWGRFWAVELPLAGPVLLANIRVVSVTTVSLLSVGSLVGVTTLGYLFLDGYQRDFPTEVFIGIAFIVIIALVFDGLLVLLGKILLPWTRSLPKASRASATRVAAEVVS